VIIPRVVRDEHDKRAKESWFFLKVIATAVLIPAGILAFIIAMVVIRYWLIPLIGESGG